MFFHYFLIELFMLRSAAYHFLLYLLQIISVFGLQQLYWLRCKCGFLGYKHFWVRCIHQIFYLSPSSILGPSQLIYLQILLLSYSLSLLYLVIQLHVNFFSVSFMARLPFFLFSILLLLSRFQSVYFLLIWLPFL